MINSYTLSMAAFKQTSKLRTTNDILDLIKKNLDESKDMGMDNFIRVIYDHDFNMTVKYYMEDNDARIMAVNKGNFLSTIYDDMNNAIEDEEESIFDWTIDDIV